MSAPSVATATPVRFFGATLRRDLVILAVVMAVGALVPSLLNRGLIFIAGMVWINAVFGLAFNLLFGLGGVLSFGQAMFFAAGAYAAAVLTQQFELPFALAWLLAGGVGAAIAAAVGAVALRRNEDALKMLSNKQPSLPPFRSRRKNSDND